MSDLRNKKVNGGDKVAFIVKRDADGNKKCATLAYGVVVGATDTGYRIRPNRRFKVSTATVYRKCDNVIKIEL